MATTEKRPDPHAVENQRIVEQLVRREVVYCVSSLMYHFGQHPEALEGSDYSYDDILELSTQSDYATAAESYIDEMERDEMMEYLDEEGTEYSKRQVDDSLRRLVRETVSGDEEKFCQEKSIDPEQNEALEHWIVTEWVAKKLAAKGEITGEFMGMTIWGRCCSGQSIHLDSVWCEIADEMEILKGQAHEWKD